VSITDDYLAAAPVTSRLKSRNPIWNEPFVRDENFIYDADEKWRDSWIADNVRNRYLIDDPTIKLNGMDKDRNTWSQINRFRTSHGRCADTLFKWNVNRSPNCDCSEVAQTTNHIVNDCGTRRLAGGLKALHEVTPDAVQWLQLMDVKL